jgi:hypothetical protein
MALSDQLFTIVEVALFVVWFGFILYCNRRH